jgi:hypothetical protein
MARGDVRRRGETITVAAASAKFAAARRRISITGFVMVSRPTTLESDCRNKAERSDDNGSSPIADGSAFDGSSVHERR